MLSDIFIFVKILKLKFLPKFEILWENFEKIQSSGPKFSQNFSWDINEIFGTATLPIICL